MSNKRIRLPREGLAGPEDQSRNPGFIDGTTDVEGHGWVNPAPPADFTRRTPSHGGELLPTDADDDVEGHRRA